MCLYIHNVSVSPSHTCTSKLTLFYAGHMYTPYLSPIHTPTHALSLNLTNTHMPSFTILTSLSLSLAHVRLQGVACHGLMPVSKALQIQEKGYLD